MLRARASPTQRRALAHGLRRLLDPAAMGQRWKAMAVTAPGLAAPAGFSGPEPER
jgi:hypothetical protein